MATIALELSEDDIRAATQRCTERAKASAELPILQEVVVRLWFFQEVLKGIQEQLREGLEIYWDLPEILQRMDPRKKRLLMSTVAGNDWAEEDLISLCPIDLEFYTDEEEY